MTHRDTASSSPGSKHRLQCSLASGCSEAHSAPPPPHSSGLPFLSLHTLSWSHHTSPTQGAAREAICWVPAPEKALLALLVTTGDTEDHSTLPAAGIICKSWETGDRGQLGCEKSMRTRLKVSLSTWRELKSAQGCYDSQEEEEEGGLWGVDMDWRNTPAGQFFQWQKICWSPAWPGQPWCPGSALSKGPCGPGHGQASLLI